MLPRNYIGTDILNSLLMVAISVLHLVQEIPSVCDFHIAMDERSNPSAFVLNLTKQWLSLHN